MVRDGSYVEAKDLKEKQSLMPLYMRLNAGKDKNLQGYQEIYQPETQTWEFAHRLQMFITLFMERILKIVAEFEHHKDFHKLNNDPRNIQRLQWQEHRQIHQQYLKTLWENPAFRQK